MNPIKIISNNWPRMKLRHKVTLVITFPLACLLILVASKLGCVFEGDK